MRSLSSEARGACTDHNRQFQCNTALTRLGLGLHWKGPEVPACAGCSVSLNVSFARDVWPYSGEEFLQFAALPETNATLWQELRYSRRLQSRARKDS